MFATKYQPVYHSLENRIFEIVTRCIHTAWPTLTGDRVVAIAEPLTQAFLDIIVGGTHGYGTEPYTVKVASFTTFELWNRILDEIQKELPQAQWIEVTAERVTRSQWKAFKALHDFKP